MTATATWILALLMNASPPEKAVRATINAGPDVWEDGKQPVVGALDGAIAARIRRYTEIAEAAEKVFFDPAEAPLFKGDYGRHKTVALAAGIWVHESGLSRNVDLGLGKRAFGDSGASFCLAQIQLGSGKILMKGDVWEYNGAGWSGKDLVKDREKCFRAQLHVMRHSFKTCSKNPTPQLLNAYTSGKCEYGAAASEKRFNLGVELFKATPFTVTSSK